MWHFLLSCQLFHLIQQYMHLELGAQILQTTVAEGLSTAMGRGRYLKRTFNYTQLFKLNCMINRLFGI